MAVTKQ